MVFKYNSIWPKGKRRKDGSKGYLKPIVKPSPTDKEKTEERKGDIPEEHLGGNGTLEHPPLFEPMEEEKTENVEEEESEKEEKDAEGREMGRKKKKKKKFKKKKKKKKVKKKKKEEEDEKEEEEDKGTAASEGRDKLREVNKVCKCVKIAPGLKRKEKEKKRIKK